MTIAIQSALVRIWSTDGQVIGSGFLVTHSHVLTCAHVVNSALGHSQFSKPEMPVSIDFPFVAPRQMKTAVVHFWLPKQNDETGDIAGLELVESAPEGTLPIRLVTASDVWKHPFRAFGFPVNHDNGLWASGVLRDRKVNGHVQIEDTKTPGIRVQPGFSGAPVWDETLHGAVGMIVTAERRAENKIAFIIPASILVESWPDLRIWTMPPNPYRGLKAFDQEDADLFFGREQFVEQLQTAVTHKPFVAVIGPSGSGKSSVVFAGLLPKIDKETAVVSFRPSSQPFRALADALMTLWQPDLQGNARLDEARILADKVASSERQLVEVINDSLRRDVDHSRLLLVVDQFEELYTLCPEPQIRSAFADCLLTAVQSQAQQNQVSFTFLMVMRADFMGRATEDRLLSQALQNATYILGPMTREELATAVEKPAQTAGVQFELGLVTRILDDVGNEPGNLPLLEFALTLLWEQQKNSLLAHAAYEAIDHVEGALAQYAERQFASLNSQDQGQARFVFTQLIQPGRSTEDARRQATLSEIGEGNWDLIIKLADARLIVTNRRETGEEIAEIVHEVLIRRWKRLQEWMNEERRFREWQERLREAMRQWKAANKDEAALLRGSLLAEAEGWLQERDVQLQSPEERVFIEKGVIFRESVHLTQIRRRNAVLAASLIVTVLFVVLGLFSYGQSQDLAVEGTRAAENEGTAVANAHLANAESTRAFENEGTAVANSMALATEVYIRQQAEEEAISAQLISEAESERAEREALLSRSRELAAVSLSILDEDAELSLLFALEAVETAQTMQSEEALRRALVASRVRYRFPGRANNTQGLAWSPDGSMLAISDPEKSLTIWDVADQQVLKSITVDTNSYLSTIEWSPKQEFIALLLSNNKLVVWNLLEGEIKLEIEGYTDSIDNLIWSPEGDRLVFTGCTLLEEEEISCSESDIYMLAIEINEEPILIDRVECNDDRGICRIHDISWDPDGTYIAAGLSDGTMWLWDTRRNADTAQRIDFAEFGIYSLDWQPNGQNIALMGYELLRIWNPVTERVEKTAPTYVSGSLSTANVEWSYDGHWLLYNDQNHKIRMWEPDTGEMYLLTGHADKIEAIQWQPHGNLLASASHDGEVLIWDTGINRDSSMTVLKRGLAYWVNSVDWHPSSQILAFDHYGLELWNVNTKEWITINDARPYEAVVWSPEGDRLAFASSDNSIHIWNMVEREEILILTGHTDIILDIDWNPDGSQLVSASGDHTVIIWDTGSGARIKTIKPDGQENRGNIPGCVDWSPDGKFLAFSLAQPELWIWNVSQNIGNKIEVSERDLVYDVAWNPNGTQIATASGDLKVWDSITGSLVFTNFGSDQPFVDVKSVAWHPDGYHIAFGDTGGMIRTWDTKSHQSSLLSGHQGEVISLAWSPNGNLLASGSRDFTARVYLTNINDLIALGKEHISWYVFPNGERFQRTILLEENEQYLGESITEETFDP